MSWARRVSLLVLLVLLTMLQVRLWFGPNSVAKVRAFEDAVADMRRANAELEGENKELKAEVIELKAGLATVEAHARSELGMIRNDETFFFLPESR